MHQTTDELNLRTFNTIFNDYRQRFVRFAVTYVNDTEIAEDIVMESFEAAWENRAVLTTVSLPAYTLTTIKNKSLNHLRSKYVRMRAAENIYSQNTRILATRISTLQACDPEELFSAEAQQLVQQSLDKLPARTREIFMRSRVQGQSYKEIAAELNITVKSVEFEISKATKRLRISLKDYLPLLFFLFGIN